MSESSEDLARKSSGVTPAMMDAAVATLKEFGVGRLSRRIDNREIIFEMLSSAVKATGRSLEGVVLDEAGWAEYFKKCSVVVRDPDVGQQIFQEGLKTPAGFKGLIETIARNGAIVVPITDYPGIVLFRKFDNSVSEESRPKKKTAGNDKEQQ